jgi:DNA-directed RNA polymerase specialized sigma subunit
MKQYSWNTSPPFIIYNKSEHWLRERGANMGREEKRLRERTVKQLTKRLQREPTEEEIDKEIENFRKAQGLAPGRDRKV